MNNILPWLHDFSQQEKHRIYEHKDATFFFNRQRNTCIVCKMLHHLNWHILEDSRKAV